MADTGETGLTHKAHLAPAALDDDRRSAPRRELLLETSGATADGRDANVTVYNLSTSGLQMETEETIQNGELLSVDLPGAGPVLARVVWVSGKLIGCAFEEPLNDAALAAAQFRSEADVAAATGGSTMAARLGGDLLGAKLNRLRREKGLTLAQLAEKLGVSKPTVWAWEKSKARPLADRFEAIADALGVSVEELSESAQASDGDAILEECRLRIATAYGTTPAKVRIMIEL